MRRLVALLGLSLIEWQRRHPKFCLIGIACLVLIYPVYAQIQASIEASSYQKMYASYQKTSCNPYPAEDKINVFNDNPSINAISAVWSRQECIGISDGRSHFGISQDNHLFFPDGKDVEPMIYTAFTLPVSSCASDQNQDFYEHYYVNFRVCPGNDAILAYEAAQTMFLAINQLNQKQTAATGNIQSNIYTLRADLWDALKGIDILHPLPLSELPGHNATVTFLNGERVDCIIQFFYIGTDAKISSLGNTCPV